MIYKVITSNVLQDFRYLCDGVIEAGYRPHGSLSVIDRGSFLIYTQAFTYENRNN